MQYEHVYPFVCPTVQAVPLAPSGWFGVALWRCWPSAWPEYIGYVETPSAFEAIAAMMRFHGLWKVAYASARALDGSLIYRAYSVFVPLIQEPENVDTSNVPDDVDV